MSRRQTRSTTSIPQREDTLSIRAQTPTVMKSLLSATLSLAGLVAALPASDPGRILPANWQYKITSLRGPGCPDFGKDPDVGRTTRLTFGQNTVDGSEIYYWFVAYPHLRVNLDDNDRSWCETELSYEEFSDQTQKTPAADYRLRLHKNGTRVIATYDLEKGVKATFKFTYEEGGGETVCFPTQPFTLHANVMTRRLPISLHGRAHSLPASTRRKIAPLWSRTRYTNFPSVARARLSSAQSCLSRARKARRVSWQVSIVRMRRVSSSITAFSRGLAMIGRSVGSERSWCISWSFLVCAAEEADSGDGRCVCSSSSSCLQSTYV
jgi:hypothetical protein